MTGGAGAKDATITDFEGRVVVRSGNSLKITGDSAAQIMVRWRFTKPKSVTVNGAAAKMVDGAGWVGVQFDHLKESVVAWQ
jgi:alpha-D-xyloside xylohydrolase